MIQWFELSGSETAQCASWREDKGVTIVEARDAAWKMGRVTRRDGLPGRITVFQRPRPSLFHGGWADGSAVGRAKVDLTRRWTQRGGVNWTPECQGERPRPFQPSPTDCGQRTYKTRNAVFLPQLRISTKTLDALMANASPTDVRRAGQVYFAVAFTIPTGGLYRRCMTTQHAPEFPANLGFQVGSSLGLRKLQPGKTTRIEREWSGPCGDDVDESAGCQAAIELELDIRRWKPDERFP